MNRIAIIVLLVLGAAACSSSTGAPVSEADACARLTAVVHELRSTPNYIGDVHDAVSVAQRSTLVSVAVNKKMAAEVQASDDPDTVFTGLAGLWSACEPRALR